MSEIERLSISFAKKTTACTLMLVGAFAVGLGFLASLPGNLLFSGGMALCNRVAAWTYPPVRLGREATER